MRDLIRYIKGVVKKQEPEEPQEDETSEFSSGAMKLSWEASTGDFEVDFLIDDLSDDSVETLHADMDLVFCESCAVEVSIEKQLDKAIKIANRDLRRS